MSTIKQDIENNRLNIPNNDTNLAIRIGQNVGRTGQSVITPLGDFYKENNLYEDHSQYDNNDFLYAENPLEYIQENRAARQTAWDKLGNDAVKMGQLAASTFLDGTIGTVVGVANSAVSALNGNSAENNLESFWNNPFSNLMADWNNKTEKALPNYYTKDELANPLAWRNIFSTNFWGDQVLKNLGFAIGAIASGAVTGVGLEAGAAKLGLSAEQSAARIGVALGKDMTRKQINTLFKNLYKGIDSESIAGLTDDLAKQGITSTDDVINVLKNEYRTAKNVGITKEVTSSLVGSMGEARFEAINNSQQFEKDLRLKNQESIQKTGKPLYSDEDIDVAVRNYGNSVFGMNVAILTASNMIEFGKVFNPGYQAEKELMGSVTNQVDKLAKYGIENKNLIKAYNYGKAIIKNPLTEGLEEGTQYAIQVGYEDYYTKHAKNISKGDNGGSAGEWIGSFIKALPKQFSDVEGLQNFIGGALIGALGVPTLSFNKVNRANVGPGIGALRIAGGVYDEIREVKENAKFTKEAIDAANNYASKDNVNKTLYSALNISSQIADEKIKATQSGDEDAYNALVDSDRINTITSLHQIGRVDDLKTMLDEAKNSSDEEIMNNFSIKDDKGERKFYFKNAQEARNKLNENIDNYSKTIDKVVEAYDSVKKRYSGISNDVAKEMTRQIVSLDKLKSNNEEIQKELSKIGGSIFGETTSAVFNKSNKILDKKEAVQKHIDERDSLSKEISSLEQENKALQEDINTPGVESKSKYDRYSSNEKKSSENSKKIDENNKTIKQLQNKLKVLDKNFFTENSELQNEKESPEETFNNLKTTLDKFHTATETLGELSKTNFNEYVKAVELINKYAKNIATFRGLQKQFLDLSVAKNSQEVEDRYNKFKQSIDKKRAEYQLQGLRNRLKTGVFVREKSTGKVFKVTTTKTKVNLFGKLNNRFNLKQATEKLNDSFFDKYEYLDIKPQEPKRNEESKQDNTESKQPNITSPNQENTLGVRLVDGEFNVYEDTQGNKHLNIKGSLVKYKDNIYVMVKDSNGAILYRTEDVNGELNVLPDHFRINDPNLIQNIQNLDKKVDTDIEGEIIDAPSMGGEGVLYTYLNKILYEHKDDEELSDDDLEQELSDEDKITIQKDIEKNDNFGIIYGDDDTIASDNEENETEEIESIPNPEEAHKEMEKPQEYILVGDNQRTDKKEIDNLKKAIKKQSKELYEKFLKGQQITLDGNKYRYVKNNFKFLKVQFKTKSKGRKNFIFIKYENGKYLDSRNNQEVQIRTIKSLRKGIYEIEIKFASGKKFNGISSYSRFIANPNYSLGYYDFQTTKKSLQEVAEDYESQSEGLRAIVGDDLKNYSKEEIEAFDKFLKRNYLILGKEFYKYNKNIKRLKSVTVKSKGGKSVTSGMSIASFLSSAKSNGSDKKILVPESKKIPSTSVTHNEDGTRKNLSEYFEIVDQTNEYTDGILSMPDGKKRLVRIYNTQKFFKLSQTGLSNGRFYGVETNIKDKNALEKLTGKDTNDEDEINTENTINDKQLVHADKKPRQSAYDVFWTTSSGVSNDISSIQEHQLNHSFLMNNIPIEYRHSLQLHVLNVEQFEKAGGRLSNDLKSRFPNQLIACVRTNDGNYLFWNNETKQIEFSKDLSESLKRPSYTYLYEGNGKIHSDNGFSFARIQNTKEKITSELKDFAKTIKNTDERVLMFKSISEAEKSDNKYKFKDELQLDSDIENYKDPNNIVDFENRQNNHPLVNLYIDTVIKSNADKWNNDRNFITNELNSGNDVILNVSDITTGIDIGRENLEQIDFSEILGHNNYEVIVKSENDVTSISVDKQGMNNEYPINIKLEKGKTYVVDKETGNIYLADRNTLSDNDIDSVLKLVEEIAKSTNFVNVLGMTIPKESHMPIFPLYENGINYNQNIGIQEALNSILFFQPINNLNEQGRLLYKDAKERLKQAQNAYNDLLYAGIEDADTIEIDEIKQELKSILSTNSNLVNKNSKNNFYIENSSDYVGGLIVIGEKEFPLLKHENGIPLASKELNPEMLAELIPFLKQTRYNLRSNTNSTMSNKRIVSIEETNGETAIHVKSFTDGNNKSAFSNAILGDENISSKISGSYPKGTNIEELVTVNKKIRFQMPENYSRKEVATDNGSKINDDTNDDKDMSWLKISDTQDSSSDITLSSFINMLSSNNINEQESLELLNEVAMINGLESFNDDNFIENLEALGINTNKGSDFILNELKKLSCG